ncbi:DUF4190 domain-containing protein [Actinoplanes sp. NPDC049596]|uniref:DUF4190 domain-containing protein n=1 Tax=unclassified Actinoplanes TaxID=2626549 RepID=UPI0034217C4C
MTCASCGSTAVRPNGYCATCGRPAAAPQAGWAAPGPTAGYSSPNPAGYDYGQAPAHGYPPPGSEPVGGYPPAYQGQPYVNAAVPPYGVPQNLPYGALPMAPRAVGNNLSIAAFVLAGVAFLLVPLLGALGVIFGAVALRRGERLGRLGLIVAIVGTVLGFAASAALRLL